MYYYYAYGPGAYPHVYSYQPAAIVPPAAYHREYPVYSGRQQTVQGQATWTEGGPVTKCGSSWSDYQYMTAAVGESSPYQCGQSLKIRNVTTGREIIVTVVDQVQGFPPNRINLQRRAFEALGANTDVGVINIEITPSPELEEESWGRYLLEITQRAYPNYEVTDYQSMGTTQVNTDQTRETYEFTLQSPQETMKVQARVTYNPNTDRVVSFDLKEI
ncbi:DUF3889 domain-containing protein [Salibacterium aidingense]|uniref:DUF3889 domain-containing protein n=1 Tax=Salibacterium aidingense TaxID=384933 RepID=UPI000421C004|nr:DUF3889 domain-containing protein [Salibacterium aidingense]